jgi:hypothetical protein
MAKREFDPEVTEQEWLTGTDLWAIWRSLPWIGGYSGHQRKRLLLAVAIVRRVEELMTDPRSLAVVPVAEAFADQLATDDAMDSAHRAAFDAEAQSFPDPARELAAVAARKLWNSWTDLGEAAGAAIAAEVHRWSPSNQSIQYQAVKATETGHVLRLIRDVFGNPFRAVEFDATWRGSNVTRLARAMYDSRDFAAMPVLADALAESGCNDAAILEHCRDAGPHVRGCWVVDLVLDRE